MGCEETSILNYECSYNVKTMTINNFTDELIKVFPLSNTKLLASSSKNFKILDTNTEKEIETVEYEDEIFNLTIYNNILIEGSCNGDLIIQNIKTKKTNRLGGHISTVTVLIILKNGNLLTAASDGVIFIWNLEKMEEICHFVAHRKSVIWNVCEISNGIIISTCDNQSKMWVLKNKPKDRCVLVFNTPNCKCLSKLKSKRIIYNNFNNLIVYKIDKIPDISENVPEIKNKKLNEPEFVIKKAHDTEICYIYCLKNGEIISGSVDGVIKIFQSELKFQCVGELEGHSDRINYIAEYPDDKLVTCGSDRKLCFWEKGKSFADGEYNV